MATKLYTVENLLIGKNYRSTNRKGLEGEIRSAEKREGIWYGENTEAYLVQVKPERGEYFYATVAVKVGE